MPFITAIQRVNSSIISRIDYCNSFLCGVSGYQLNGVQSFLNGVALLVYGRTGPDHVTDLIRDRLHWLCS